ncbi:hypothetical protein SBOR_1282 [Sclerotinia borealis F-4128]|uniref:DUF4604 domain-containing protein n=1 Tax=Sclerotinia borealis (strain F-4128) TaxID=1432307 RepID=W9CUN6_SCLBF|nr:hypothetical protein SBOR_1282 [Sclerotinia borealis F-4128]
MSNPKITPKNLSYDNTLPPFLQRLQANHSSSDGRHEFSIARPSKLRDEEEERESEPVVFDEVSGETLSREEWERREKTREERDGGEGGDGEGEGKEGGEGEGKGNGKTEIETAKMAGIGASKKRKMGKIIGGLEDEDAYGNEEISTSTSTSTSNNKTPNRKDIGKQKKEESSKAGATGKKNSKTAAKKGKKIKLSFGDDE